MEKLKNKFGLKLKERRETLGLTVQQVFEQTRVPIQYIVAFEEQNFNVLTRNPNVRAFLESYCHYLNIDPRPYYDVYLEWLRMQRSTDAPSKTAGKNVISREEPIILPSWLEPVITWSIVLSVLILSWFVYNFFTQSIREAPSTKANASTVEAPAIHFEEDF
ncbi:MAG TPA: helix-turn-helix domain-containing protein [Candidatus Hydrogenedens sp.]|nr:helix-turn-helix domain-containing protein [Candidatus Hydrogenedens sp.]